MRITTDLCDFCGIQINKNNSEVSCNHLLIKHSQSCTNPLEELDRGNSQNCTVEVKDICWECARKLSSEILAMMKRMKDQNHD